MGAMGWSRFLKIVSINAIINQKLYGVINVVDLLNKIV